MSLKIETADQSASTIRGVHQGLPSWFRATCSEAARGGAGTYRHAGRKLAESLGSETPCDIEIDEWADCVDELNRAIGNESDARVWQWFCDHLPRFARLIPARRRVQFIAGIREAFDEGDISV